MDTLGHLLALHVTPANEQEREQVGVLAEAVQEVTGDNVQLAWVDQGYTGPRAAEAAEHGIQLEVVKLAKAQERLCAPASALGGRAHLWLDRPLLPLGARL